MPSPLTLEEAKLRLRIPDLWRIFNLPGEPKKSCKSPFREEQHASFSVSEDGLLYHDFATGIGGDALDFLMEVMAEEFFMAWSDGNAPIRKFIELAGGQPEPPSVLGKATASPRIRKLPELPIMRNGTPSEHRTLATLRHVHVEAIKIADSAGLLRFGKWKGYPAWFITEQGGRNAQARRLDGQPWKEIGAKAQTLPGCWASWPIGAGLGNYQTLCLVEGGPDLLAALHYIHLAERGENCFPVAMLGAGQRIHADALPLLAGKRIRIYAHADEPGRTGARRWKAQLEAVGCRVDAVDFSGLRKANGSPVNDLNDTTEIHPDDAGELEGLLAE